MQKLLFHWIAGISGGRRYWSSVWNCKRQVLWETRYFQVSRVLFDIESEIMLIWHNCRIPLHHVSGDVAMIRSMYERKSPLFTFKGAIIFYREGGPSVMAGHQFFLVPPFAYVKKILVPPFGFVKKFWSPPWDSWKNSGPPPLEEHPLGINNVKGQ